MTAHTYGDTLRHRGLQPFLWTQFLGAFNDNLLKSALAIVVTYRLAEHSPPATCGRLDP